MAVRDGGGGGGDVSSSSAATAAAPGAADADASGPSVESWSERDQRIVVSQPAAGYLYDLTLRAKIDAPPERVYGVLTDPRSHEIFRGIRDTLERATVADDGRGRRKLRIKHRAVTRFLWLSVAFDTELFVWEDDVDRTIRFTNARGDGFMKRFEGTWRVAPFTQATLNGIFRQQQQQQQGLGLLATAAAHQQQQQQHQHRGWLPNPVGALSSAVQRLHHGGGGGGGREAALVTLEQALAPRARPPGPLAPLVRGLCARVLQNMMADLRAEVDRREARGTITASSSSSAAAGTKKKSRGKQPAAAAAADGGGGGGNGSQLPVASITSSTQRGGGGAWWEQLQQPDVQQQQQQQQPWRRRLAGGALVVEAAAPDLWAHAAPVSLIVRL